MGDFNINIRGLPKHFDDLSEFPLTLNRSFSVIAVSETWLRRSNSNLFHFPGYHFIFSHREHKAGDGVGLYVQCHLKFKLRTDLGVFVCMVYRNILSSVCKFSSHNKLLSI